MKLIFYFYPYFYKIGYILIAHILKTDVKEYTAYYIKETVNIFRMSLLFFFFRVIFIFRDVLKICPIKYAERKKF